MGLPSILTTFKLFIYLIFFIYTQICKLYFTNFILV